MNQIIEKPERKNEWGLIEAKKPTVHWKESPEYKKTEELIRNTYGPFGKVVFTGLGVVALVAVGIWGLSFVAGGLESLVIAIRDIGKAGGFGAGVSSVAGALFSAVWNCGVAAVILFPVWHGFRFCYGRFLILTSNISEQPVVDAEVIDLTEKR